MNRPDPTPDDRALQEVQQAYRDLPGVEPDAQLDARVRAAVAAEVSSERAATPIRGTGVVPFRRWRRVALPFAAAAAVLVAIGVNHFERRPATDRSAEPPARTDIVPTAPLLAAQSPAGAPERFATATPASRPQSPRQQPVNTPLLDLPQVMGPPPAAKARRAPDAQELTAARSSMAEATLARATDTLSDLAPAPAKPAAAAGAQVPGGAATTPPEDTAEFIEIRRMLAEHRRDAARTRLKGWREAHPDAPLPADLKALEVESRQ